MTLENLLGVSLQAVEPDRASINRLLEAAARSLADAQLADMSSEGNVSDYEGDPVSASLANEAVMQAQSLFAVTVTWLQQHKSHPMS